MAQSGPKARNRFLVGCAILLSCWCASTANAQVPLFVFKTPIHGRGNVDSLPGSGDANLGKSALAVDTSGNVYVTGSTFNGVNTDYLTVKYNAAGVIQWRAVTNGAADGDDLAYSIALDTAGNVVVTGSSQSGNDLSGWQSDYLTVKYDSNGVELWRATFDGAANGDDDAYAVALDTGGNVIVTGASFVSTNRSNYDYVTVKYSPAGVEQWNISMDGVGNSTDRSVAMCLDGSGNPVVTGFSFNYANFNYDYVTVKYLANGPGQIWKQAINGVTNSNDVAFAMACDPAGNVHVTGKSYDLNTNKFDFLTAKYSSGGGPAQWQVATDGFADLNKNDASFAIAVDGSGNVIVKGQSDQDNNAAPSVTNPLHLAVKYNSGGVIQWRAALNSSGNGTDAFSALATDTAGNVYTSGFADNNGSNELVVVKYSPAGAQLWQSFVNPGGGSNATILGIHVDGIGNVVVAGYRNVGLDNDFLVIKLNNAGQVVWSANEGENTGLATSLAAGATGRYAAATDTAGNIYVTGQSGSTGSSDFVTAKINGNGAEQWRAVLNGNAGGMARAYALALDNSQNVYVAGDSFANGLGDFMTVKYDASGGELWRAIPPGHAPNALNSVRAMAVDPAGDVVVTGYSSASADFLTVKYAANGVEQWRQVTNGAANGEDTPVAMAIDPSGNVFVTGRSFDGAYDGYLTVKFSSGGVPDPQWRKVLNGSANAPQQPFAIAVGTGGNVFVTGDTTVKYDQDGIQQWYRTDTFRAYAIATGPAGSVVVGGAGGAIVKYEDTGGEVWRRAINGSINGDDVVYSLAVDADGGVYAFGRNVTNSGDYQTVKFDALGNERWRVTTSTAVGGVTGFPALLLDSSRNVIVAANAIENGLPAAIMVTKYSQAPSPPTGVFAVPGNGIASINFTPPAATESPVTGYTVSCLPGTVTVSGSSSPILLPLANDVTYACSVTATNAYGVGPASAPASVTPVASAPLALFAVQSRKTHGTAGDFNIDVSLAPLPTDAVTVEPRAIGGGHKLQFKFNNIVTSVGTASVTPVGSASAVLSGNDVLVTLTGMPDNQRVQVTLSGVNGTTNASVTMGFLMGDINNTRSVNAADISGAKARIGQPVNLSNFRLDLDASGIVNAPDLATIKSRSGLVLP